MTKVEFQYKDIITTIQPSEDDTLRQICSKFVQKTQIDMNKVVFIYSGNTLNPDLTLAKTINKIDKERKKMIIMVSDIGIEPDNKSIFISPQAVCPVCKEHARYELKNHRLKIYNCKNGHTTEDLLISELENTQLIDESKIICDGCKIKNKANTYNNEMYVCNLCHMNLCPLCKSSHDKKHKIINYYDKYYICDKHNKEYNAYCEQCKKDICVICQKEHEFHKIIPYCDLIPELHVIGKLEEAQGKSIFTKNYFFGLSNKINLIIDRLNNIKKNVEVYLKFIERNFDNYNINNINYNILQNINYITDIIGPTLRDRNFEEIADVLGLAHYTSYESENNKNNFIFKILNIYNEMNKNEIDLIYNIPNNQDKIKIFGKYFVPGNNDYCKIICENKEYELTEYFDCKNIKNNKLEIKLKGINNVADLSFMFAGCSELSYQSNFSNLDTTYTSNIERLFQGCQFEKLPDISKFNTINVINMDSLFSGCTLLKSIPDISNWNTSNVLIMSEMFSNCSSLESLPDLSKWDISSVLEKNNMFENCSDSLNIPEKFKDIK